VGARASEKGNEKGMDGGREGRRELARRWAGHFSISSCSCQVEHSQKHTTFAGPVKWIKVWPGWVTKRQGGPEAAVGGCHPGWFCKLSYFTSRAFDAFTTGRRYGLPNIPRLARAS
jgi:hypothetical protein